MATQATNAAAGGIRPSPSSVRGFSLVELMVAMLLGLIIVAALAQLYVGGRETQQIVDANASLTEKARFALEFFARDIRMAGYFSCGGHRASVANALNSGAYWLELRGVEAIEGGDGSGAVSGLPAVFDDLPTPVPGSDILIVRYADTRRLVPIGGDDLVVAENEFRFDTTHNFAVGDVAVVNGPSCAQTSVFQVTGLPAAAPGTSISYDSASADAAPANCTDDIAGSFTCADLARSRTPGGTEFAGGDVAKLIARAFFVATPPEDQCNPSVGSCAEVQDCPTLYIAGSENDSAVAVLRDVVGVQFNYGIDVDETPGVDGYVTADQLPTEADWENVTSIRTTLRMIRSDCSPVEFNGTVALRNQATLPTNE